MRLRSSRVRRGSRRPMTATVEPWVWNAAGVHADPPQASSARTQNVRRASAPSAASLFVAGSSVAATTYQAPSRSASSNRRRCHATRPASASSAIRSVTTGAEPHPRAGLEQPLGAALGDGAAAHDEHVAAVEEQARDEGRGPARRRQHARLAEAAHDQLREFVAVTDHLGDADLDARVRLGPVVGLLERPGAQPAREQPVAEHEHLPRPRRAGGVERVRQGRGGDLDEARVHAGPLVAGLPALGQAEVVVVGLRHARAAADPHERGVRAAPLAHGGVDALVDRLPQQLLAAQVARVVDAGARVPAAGLGEEAGDVVAGVDAGADHERHHDDVVGVRERGAHRVGHGRLAQLDEADADIGVGQQACHPSGERAGGAFAVGVAGAVRSDHECGHAWSSCIHW